MSSYLSEFTLIADYHKRLPDIILNSGQVGVQVVLFYETGYYDKSGSFRARQHHVTVKAWGKSGDQLSTLYAPGDKLLIKGEVNGREWNEKYYSELTVHSVQPFDAHLRKISDKAARTIPELANKVSDSMPDVPQTKADEDSDLPF